MQRKLPQEKLAELADLHRNYVGGIERGDPLRPPDFTGLGNRRP
jgi:transcriptional regulator with XRE-family HTH domain